MKIGHSNNLWTNYAWASIEITQFFWIIENMGCQKNPKSNEDKETEEDQRITEELRRENEQ